MASRVKMQAQSSTSLALVPWVTDTADFAGVMFPGPGSPLDIAVSSDSIASPNFSSVATWHVDPVNGNDSHDGLTKPTAFRSVAHLQQLLCPGGSKIFFNQGTTIWLYAGTHEELELNYEIVGAVTFVDQLVVRGETSITATITVATSVTEDIPTQRSAEITTASGTFVPQQRLRITNGVQTDTIAYSSGLNGSAQDTFTGNWLNYDAGSILPPVPGSIVVHETLLTTIKRLYLNGTGTGNPQPQDLIITEACQLNDAGGKAAVSSTGGFGFIRGCDLLCLLVSNTGGYLWSSRVPRGATCRVKEGFWKGDGCSIQGNLYVFPGAGFSPDDFGNILDGGNFIPGGMSASNRIGPATVRVAGPLQLCNGTASNAIELGQGCEFQIGNNIWSRSSAGGNYTTLFALNAGSKLTSSVGFTFTAAATNGFNVAGKLYPLSAAPLICSQVGCIVSLSGLTTGEINASIYVPGLSGNQAPANLFSVAPRKGLYLALGYFAGTTLDAAATGAPTLNLLFVDDTFIAQSVPLLTASALTSKNSKGGMYPVETNGASIPQWSVTGITNAGSSQYSVRITMRLDSDG